MYTKTTAACGSHCNGKAHYPKTFGSTLSFPFFPIGLQIEILVQIPTPALSISLQWIAYL